MSEKTTAPVAPIPEVTIEIVAQPKSTSTHAGEALKPGDRVKMRKDKADRHVAAGNARIVPQ